MGEDAVVRSGPLERPHFHAQQRALREALFATVGIREYVTVIFTPASGSVCRSICGTCGLSGIDFTDVYGLFLDEMDEGRQSPTRTRDNRRCESSWGNKSEIKDEDQR